MRQGNRTKGFTLIELLIVIAIIGILAAVLIPNLLSARRLAQDRAAQAYGSQVYTAIMGHIAEDPAHAFADAGETCVGGFDVAAISFKVADPGTPVKECEIATTATTVLVTVTSINDVEYEFGDAAED